MVKLNKIYTRTGDDGTTGLVDGSRIAKSDVRMAAIGDVDELNSAIGMAIVALQNAAGETGALEDHLKIVQNDLFDLGADLATPGDDFAPSDMVLRIVPGQVMALEDAIDRLNDALEPLTSFILPGGSAAAAAVHMARTICRRAERTMAHMAQTMPVNPAGAAYINRLSDYLFVLARHINKDNGGDPLWVPGGSR